MCRQRKSGRAEDGEPEVLLYVLILIGIGIIVSAMLIVATRRQRETPKLTSLGVFTEPEAYLARDRLRSQGVWADIRHVGGVAVLSIELGSIKSYGVVVLARDEAIARQILGLEEPR